MPPSFMAVTLAKCSSFKLQFVAFGRETQRSVVQCSKLQCVTLLCHELCQVFTHFLTIVYAMYP
jgi:hypothetical protein